MDVVTQPHTTHARRREATANDPGQVVGVGLLDAKELRVLLSTSTSQSTCRALADKGLLDIELATTLGI